MTLNLETVKTNIYNWLVSILPSEYSIIFWNQNGPRPTENPPASYLTIFMATFIEIGEDYTPEPTEDSGDVTMQGDREFTITLQTYGGDCMTRLENIRSSLQKLTVLDTLRANGIVFVRHFPILDTSQIINTRFEIRANMDILFRIGQTYPDTLGSIATVNVEEIIEDSAGTIVFDETITIPNP